MPQGTENERVNRYATRSNVNRLKAAAGMPNSARTMSRFGFARLNPSAPPWNPSMMAAAAAAPAPAGAASTGASRRASRRNMKGGRRHRRSTTRKAHKHRRANRR